jgi:hypothetical protein
MNATLALLALIVKLMEEPLMLIVLSGIGVLKGQLRKEIALEGIIVINILKF